MCCDVRADNCACCLGRFEVHFGKLFGAAHVGIFHQDVMGFSDLLRQVFGDLILSDPAQFGGAGFDGISVYLGHARRRCAGAWGIGEHMQPCQVAVADKAH